jgi:transposase
MRVAPSIVVTDRQRKTLEGWARGRSTPVRLTQRAQIVLRAARGLSNKDITVELGTDRQTVGRWRWRFAHHGLAGIEKDAPRGGRKPTARDQIAARIVAVTTQQTPPSATHWSTRSLAQHLSTSRAMVHRVWQANQLRPHLFKTFKVSNDPRFAEKLLAVVGLYLNPPEHALVLCADEKSQIQALDRTPKSLPLYPGLLGTQTHDYKRNGTTTLFAAIELAQGKLIGTCLPKHRHQEWIRFLELIDAQTPAALDLHLIVDNYATHKHPRVKNWLKRHPRFHGHFTPTSSSWLNRIERWFRDLTDKRIRRGVFRNVKELSAAIETYSDAHNAEPRSFQWTAKAEDILAKVRRAKAVLDKMPSG